MPLKKLSGIPPEFAGKWRPEEIRADPTKWTKAKLQGLNYIPDPLGGDHWQLPAETFKRGGGDCEDLAIAWLHYRLLKGVEAAKLSLLIVKGKRGWHALGEAPGRIYEPAAVTKAFRDTFTRIPSGYELEFRLRLDGQCWRRRRVLHLPQ